MKRNSIYKQTNYKIKFEVWTVDHEDIVEFVDKDISISLYTNNIDIIQKVAEDELYKQHPYKFSRNERSYPAIYRFNIKSIEKI